MVAVSVIQRVAVHYKNEEEVSSEDMGVVHLGKHSNSL